MNKKPIIYVDMDGVLCSFDSRYQAIFGMTPLEVRRTKGYDEYRRNWNEMIAGRHFVNLTTMDHGNQLIIKLREYEAKYGVTIAILSSSSNIESHFIVQSDKLHWLLSHTIIWPAIVVPGRAYKASYADGNAFLIDDTPSNIEDFVKAGGSAVLHEDAMMDRTLSAIEAWLESKYSK